MKQLRVKIISNDTLAPGFYRMRLRSSYLAKKAKPGQFVEVRCSEDIEPFLRRPLGCHRILRDGIELLYKVVGKGTEALSHKKSGGQLDVIGPLGKGFDITAAHQAAILVAGGIGVAPLFALAERLLIGSPVRRLAGFTVLIGACTKAHILCEKEFKKLGAEVSAATEDGSKGHKGLVTDLLKRELANQRTNEPTNKRTNIYACGPNAMLREVAAVARSRKIPCQVSLEERMACGVGVCLGCPVKVKGGYRMVCKDGPVFDAEEIVW